MRITVKLFASFRSGRNAIETPDYPAGTTVLDVVTGRGIPLADIGIVMLNSRHSHLDQVLAEGDTLAIFPLLGGG